MVLSHIAFMVYSHHQMYFLLRSPLQKTKLPEREGKKIPQKHVSNNRTTYGVHSVSYSCRKSLLLYILLLPLSVLLMHKETLIFFPFCTSAVSIYVHLFSVGLQLHSRCG